MGEGGGEDLDEEEDFSDIKVRERRRERGRGEEGKREREREREGERRSKSHLLFQKIRTLILWDIWFPMRTRFSCVPRYGQSSIGSSLMTKKPKRSQRRYAWCLVTYYDVL